MTDTTQGASATKLRPPVADRQWIDAANVEVDDPALATGCRYVDLEMQAAKLPCAFVYQTGLPACQHATMLAVCGALTKAGNIRNPLVNANAGAGPTAIHAIKDCFPHLSIIGIS